MIKNLIFDFGKVLVDYDFESFFHKYIPDAERCRAFTPILYNEELQQLLDREEQPFNVIMEGWIEKNKDFEPEIRIFNEHYPEIVTNEIEGMYDLLTHLKSEGYKLYGLTNWCSKVYHTMAQYPIFQLLDGQIISSEEKFIKPEPEIYQRLFKKYNLVPEECIFADDRAENIKGAIRSGMKGIIFKDAKQYERELRRYLNDNGVPSASKKSEECIICGAGLVYYDNPTERECNICHRKFLNNVHCKNGHYVCDECHAAGIDNIISICMQETSSNPIDIIEKMMSLPTCHMHGPEHHVMVGASLITAYRNAGGTVDLEWALSEIVRRGKQVPGGACGNWGACGAGISTGMFISIITRSNPLASTSWALSNQMTSCALTKIAETGGPRCCKRDSYNAILAAIDFIKHQLDITLDCPTRLICSRSTMNNQCLKNKCPFHTTSIEEKI